MSSTQLFLSLVIVLLIMGLSILVATIRPNLLTMTGAVVFCFVGIGVAAREIALYRGTLANSQESVRWSDDH